MKKILVVMLALMMTIVMCACGNTTSEETSEVANPVHECTKQEMLEATGMDIDAPEGATDVEYAYIDNDEAPIAQVEFELNDQDFCYRAQSTAITSLVADISEEEFVPEEDLQKSLDDAVATGAALAGLNFKWTGCASVDVPASRDGVYALNEGDEGFIAWLDVVPGVLYSLSVEDDATIDLLLDSAELVFVPMQGEVG